MHSIHVTREQLSKIIVDGTDFSAEQVAWMLPPASKGDHQNVDSMVKLLAALATLCDATVESFGPLAPEPRSELQARLLELKPLFWIGRCGSRLLQGNTLSINSHLENLSELAMYLFVVVRHKNDAGKIAHLLPRITVSSLMSMIKSHFVSVAHAIIDKIEEWSVLHISILPCSIYR